MSNPVVAVCLLMAQEETSGGKRMTKNMSCIWAKLVLEDGLKNIYLFDYWFSEKYLVEFAD